MEFYQGLTIGLIVEFFCGVAFSGLILILNERHKNRLERDGIQARRK